MHLRISECWIELLWS